jgi:NADH-quinone oxidoreductase subunit N
VTIDHLALLPGYAAALTAVLVLLLDTLVGRFTTVALAVGAALTAAAAVVPGTRSTFCAAGCSWVATPRAAVVAVLFAGLTVAVSALSRPLLRAGTVPAGEYPFLLACAMTGGVVVGYAGDLITLIVGLETLTLPLYVLVGLRRPPSATGAQASVTFFLVSVVSTAVALLGAAFVYAATGALHLSRLAPDAEPLVPGMQPLARVGVTLLLAGVAFKVAAVPLHAWAPATYDGAPVPVAAYLSTASKVGGVVALVTLVGVLRAEVLFAVLAVATMTVGNLVALRQTRTVRLLAWSSVAQAGYILAPLAVPQTAAGTAATLAYAVFFVVLELVAFAAVVALRPAGADGGELADLRGAARRAPWAGAALVVALTGLAGLPPGLAGLFAKVAVVRVLVSGGADWLAVIVALNAVIALAYYLRFAVLLYASPPDAGAEAPAVVGRVLRPVAVALAVATLLAVAAGFAPQLVFDAVAG